MREANASVFIKIDEYKDILEITNTIKQKIAEGKKTLTKINELKNTEDEELETWINDIHEIERKIDLVDQTLFEPEQ